MSPQEKQTSFFEFASRINANPKKNILGESMFSDVRGLTFHDLENGWLQTGYGELGTSGLGLWRVESTGHFIELGETDSTTIILPVRGKIDTRAGDIVRSASAGDVLLLGPGKRNTQVGPFSGDAYEAYVVLLKPRQASKLGADYVALAKPGSGAYSYMRYLFGELARKQTPLLKSDVQNAASVLLLEHIHTLFEQPEAVELSGEAGPKALRMAEDIMASRFGEALSISMIARNVGVSQRALQLAFKRYREITPRERLNRIRLSEARNRLISSNDGESVSNIALECGFAHLGRFAETYRNAYGEAPSQTLRNARSAER